MTHRALYLFTLYLKRENATAGAFWFDNKGPSNDALFLPAPKAVFYVLLHWLPASHWPQDPTRPFGVHRTFILIS